MPRKKGFVAYLCFAVINLLIPSAEQIYFNKIKTEFAFLCVVFFLILEVEFNLKLFATMSCGKTTTECYEITYYFEEGQS